MPEILPYVYASVSDVASYLNTTISSGSSDEAATLTAIYRAEKLIEDFCSRSFVVVNETRKYDGDGTESMLGVDIMSIPSIVDESYTLTSSDYFLYPYGKYPKTKIVRTHGQCFTPGQQNISITALFGYQEVALVTGKATSGTTSTIVDTTNRKEVDDYWNAYVVSVTAGTNIGKSRYITDFVYSTSTISVDTTTPFPVAIDSTSEYVIGKIPRAIRLATTRLASILLRTRGGAGMYPIVSESQGDYSVSYDPDKPLSSIDRETAAILASYVLTSFG